MRIFLFIFLFLITLRGAFGYLDSVVSIFPSRAFALIFIFAIIYNQSKEKVFGVKWVSKWFFFLVFWVFYSCMQILYMKDVSLGIRQILLLSTGVFIAYSIVALTRDTKDLQMLLNAVIFISLFNVGMGFWEHFTGNHFLLSRFGEQALLSKGNLLTRWFAPTGGHGNPNDYATALFVLTSLASGKLMTKINKAWLVTIAVLLISSFSVLVWTGSRTNMLLLVLFTFFIVIFSTPTKKHEYINVLFFICCIVGIFYYFTSDKVINILNSFWSGIESLLYWRENARIGLTVNAMYTLFVTYGFGAGANNADSFMADGPFPVYGVKSLITAPHSLYGEIMSEYGIFIFAGFVFLSVKLFKELYYISQRNCIHDLHLYSKHALILLVGLSFSVFSPSSSIKIHECWFAIGYCLSIVKIYRIDISIRTKNIPKSI